MSQLSRPEQNALAVASRSGDKFAGVAELYKFYKPRIYKRARHAGLSPEAAEDVVQGVFVSVIRNIHQFDPLKGNFENWINRITTNAINDYLKKMWVWETTQKKEK